MAGAVPAVHVVVGQRQKYVDARDTLREDALRALGRARRDEAREKPHETIRPHRKAARHQARERLELETYLRKDRRLFRSAGRRRHFWPDEADETAGGERRR